MATSSISLFHPPPPLPLRLTSISSKPNFHSSFKLSSNPSSLHLNSPHVSFTFPNSSNQPISYPHKRTQVWRIHATTTTTTTTTTSEVALSSATDQVEQITTSSGDTGVATIIQVLLFIAFVGLSILTIGVIYIAVTDFLTKREREKFEKEETEKKKKKSGKKGVVRSRTGPRGFGQKIDEDEFDD